MKLIDGKLHASQIRQTLREEIAQSGLKPKLVFILVGNDPASQCYVRMKQKNSTEVGILSEKVELKESITERELLNLIDSYNRDPTVHGILLQQPLPKQLSSNLFLSAIVAKKDVDGFHPENMGKLVLGDPTGFISCTPKGIVSLLERSNIETKGKQVVVLGRSNIVGKPIANLLMQNTTPGNATVTVLHSRSKNVKQICKQADILIAAIGNPKFVTKEMIKPGAVVIDVGINRTADGTLVGDVDFKQVAPMCSHITPVPGGVGPMTIAMLLENTFISAKRSQ